jgi:aspartate--ammonia ligase
VLIIPDTYEPALGLRDTEQAIQLIKDFFQTNLAFELNLTRVTAPLFVESGTGINDDLNGIERPIDFSIPGMNGTTAEIVQSLAKWKRVMLADYDFKPGEGLYTDMNAIRPDEMLDNTHSLYVDQWDWERVLTPEQRTPQVLIRTVNMIYDVIRRTEKYVCHRYPRIDPILPDHITILCTEDLRQRYPDLSPKDRETRICQEHGAVFLMGIGAPLGDGHPHDGRAPDYDDWSTASADGTVGLNGDILVYNPILESAYELSSMGIRVDATALKRQLAQQGHQDREHLWYHRRLLDGTLPESMGGGIGQSRLCMFYLRKAHIGEIQSSLWPEEMVRTCRDNNIHLL